MGSNTAILVISFDGYSDVWPVFFECKDRFWKECLYKTYLVTNNKDYIGNCTVIKTGDETNWCDRVIKALDYINEDNIIVLLEDYLIGREIKNCSLDEYVDFFEQNEAKYLRLINIPKKHLGRKYESIYPIMSNEEYGISLQPAIWNKNYFKEILNTVGGDRSAWEFEISLLRKCTEESKILEGCFGTKNNVLDIHNGVLKGKWFKNEIYYFRQLGIVIETDKRGVLSDKDYCSHLIRRTIREALPTDVRKKLKKILMKMNFKFVSNE